MNKVVTVLCSGMGLGVYNPSLILSNQLREKGIDSEVLVIEELFSAEKLEKLLLNKKAFHRDFQVAVMGMRIHKGEMNPNLDMLKVEGLLKRWYDCERNYFIVLSGHWGDIIGNYAREEGQSNMSIDTIRMDCDIAPSWNDFSNAGFPYNETWLFGSSDNKLEYKISVGHHNPLPFDTRENRFLVHGGGWGIGANRNRIEEISQNGYLMDIVVYEKDEIYKATWGNRHYLNDLEWNPWEKNSDGQLEYPITYELDVSGNLKSFDAKEYHSVYELCRNAKGIISKPGGGTLLDSLASATPIIFTEAIAKHERANAHFWEEFGFGISYDKWRESGFSIEILGLLHNNLVKERERAREYIDEYIRRYSLISVNI